MRAATLGLTSGQRLESVISGFLRAGKVRILCAVAAAIAAIAVTDGYVLGTRASLGLLYILPMMLAATVLPQAQTVALAFVCSVLLRPVRHALVRPWKFCSDFCWGWWRTQRRA